MTVSMYISIQIKGRASKVFQAITLYSMTFSAGAWQQQHSVSAVKCQTELILYSCGKMQTRLDRRLALCPPTTCASEGSAASGASPRYSHKQMQLFLRFTVSLLVAAQMEGMCPK